MARLKHCARNTQQIPTRENKKRVEEHAACAPSLFPSSFTFALLSSIFFFFPLYTYRGAHLPWGERILGHVDRGVADGVVSYVALSQDGTHLGVNLPRLSAAMQEVPADAPSPCRTRRAYNLTTRVHACIHRGIKPRARALVLDA